MCSSKCSTCYTIVSAHKSSFIYIYRFLSIVIISVIRFEVLRESTILELCACVYVCARERERKQEREREKLAV